MSIRFITPNAHGVIDFIVAAGLICLPFILGLGVSSPLAFWISVATGFAILVLGLFTDYRYGLFRIIPFWLHLTIDAIFALAFALVPTVLGFTGIDALYYWLAAAGNIAAVIFGKTEQDYAPDARGGAPLSVTDRSGL